MARIYSSRQQSQPLAGVPNFQSTLYNSAPKARPIKPHTSFPIDPAFTKVRAARIFIDIKLQKMKVRLTVSVILVSVSVAADHMSTVYRHCSSTVAFT
jgi:hypothetical protein